MARNSRLHSNFKGKVLHKGGLPAGLLMDLRSGYSDYSGSN